MHSRQQSGSAMVHASVEHDKMLRYVFAGMGSTFQRVATDTVAHQPGWVDSLFIDADFPAAGKNLQDTGIRVICCLRIDAQFFVLF